MNALAHLCFYNTTLYYEKSLLWICKAAALTQTLTLVSSSLSSTKASIIFFVALLKLTAGSLPRNEINISWPWYWNRDSTDLEKRKPCWLYEQCRLSQFNQIKKQIAFSLSIRLQFTIIFSSILMYRIKAIADRPDRYGGVFSVVQQPILQLQIGFFPVFLCNSSK